MNEPAFPQVNLKDSHGMLVPDRQSGMSLRDYFAAKAMQGVFIGSVMEAFSMDQDIDCDKVAKIAYTMASAMMKSRQE